MVLQGGWPWTGSWCGNAERGVDSFCMQVLGLGDGREVDGKEKQELGLILRLY